MKRIPLNIIHYNKEDPNTTTGGVQSFAKGLRLIFNNVEFMTPKNRDMKYIWNNQIPVICDNQLVADFPKKFPVIGFQHGVGAVKYGVTHSSGHRRLKHAQKKASKRYNTLWIACADWIATTFEKLYGNHTEYIIYHQIDINLFDGELDNTNSRTILHDARTEHKGNALIKEIKAAFPEWEFESLNCKPEQVPDRMRKARAFIHLSRYEGNSIVCNEAMAMNLPCMFTTVGLMQDSNRPTDVYLVDTNKIYCEGNYLIDEVGLFLKSIEYQNYNPRIWVLNNATAPISQKKWNQAMIHFQKMSGWELGLPTH